MKKSLFALVLALMVLIPIRVMADEKPYEYFDIRAEKKLGAKIKDTEITIYASVEGDEENLIDRTEEFNLEEVMWSVCVEDECATSREVDDDAVFEEGNVYILMVRITAKNEADIDVWGTDKAKYNGTPIEELAGEYSNSGKELMIKTRTSSIEGKKEEVTPTVTPEPEKKEETKEEDNKCLLGLSFCCTTFLGLSICIWIIIIIVLIILIISIFMYKAKKKTDEQLAQL